MRALLVLGLVVFGESVACSGTTTDANPSNDGGVTTSDSAVTDGGLHTDASADASTSDASTGYAAQHYPLPIFKNFGGPVIADMKITTVTFVGDADRDAKRTFDDSIVKSAWWTAVTRGYGIHAGTSGGYVELPDTVSNKTLDNDTQLVPFIQSLVASSTLPKPDTNTLYAFYFPHSTTLSLLGWTSCQQFGAYHDYAAFNVNGANVYGAFAIMPDCGYGYAGVTSHELIEAATDPYPFTTKTPPTPFTWYLYNDAWAGVAGGGEVADVCASQKAAKEGNDFVARSWVNAAAAASEDPCQPAVPGKIYFAASVETEIVTGLHDTNGGGPDYDSDGFIVMTRGQTRNVNVIAFSEKPLPHDLTLVVGARPQGNATDPAMLDPIAGGVTSTLSTTKGNNGTHLTLAITTAANVTPGDYLFVVRAILETSDYHSWPVVLRVQ